ncbi:aldehyde dehydrogenase family protein [Ponticoccus sp. SC2-23]|uniref:aldehyde dehydrogenase family protein n=1 Tax=Alexandriicola marinus TaxID=2081710 RepID=UPI000FDC7D46|nr:aldehyde dehydrogenase family protein [Alexandriicola marinus]MBM1220445.1 aldehyde dehydrogenase family protein [Ponticoccus sp. SC6-9]MBM1225131.1 aldehyde dehydrogenase family protein [Ponticoccus sp. SC6-15]MBM1228645.1 aldehyde dehydrogenase family protein [Ponticoccus sp. SC6-38]MBM1233718.1 aldehyde dehydrogenase family protein [Ponticoccus sp. SC6-45]MBM1239146.1 aldehyde dehydrogenase family protein [Ponticoccus sp. SC6-49]MBM1242928.1 aldehyde dehydrogenase family protein [Pontic
MTKVDLISPIDGSVYLSRDVLTPEQATDAASRARRAQPGWASRPLSERIEIVRKAGEIIGQTTDRMAVELAHQMGRPVRYGGEFGGFIERLGYMADVAEDSLAPMIIEDSDAFLRQIKRVPRGVVMVVAPWNYPYMTAINTVAPALIAGNSVILKHAGQTLQVGERLQEAFLEAGVPEDVFQNVVIDHTTTSALISSRAVDFVNFTGSVGGGQAMEQAAAGTFIPVSTELGGKDPGYVRADADLDAAVDTLMDGAIFNSGQCCCGIERIYVAQPLYDAFVEKAVAWAAAQKLGNPLDADTTLGPMANIRFAREVRAQVAEAVADGATAHIPQMAADDGENTYVTPQVLTGVTHDMRVMRDETFGPVVGIMPVASDDEAIALMNDSRFGLTASIWTADTDAAERIGDRLETGTVFMNRCDYLDPALCWTGCKDTGRGQGLSKLAYQALTRPKSYHLRKN